MASRRTGTGEHSAAAASGLGGRGDPYRPNCLRVQAPHNQWTHAACSPRVSLKPLTSCPLSGLLLRLRVREPYPTAGASPPWPPPWVVGEEFLTP